MPSCCAAGKFYTTDYVFVPAGQLILWANIMKLSELLENISDMDPIDALKLTLTLCFTRGLVIWYEEKNILNRLMKMLLQGLMKLKKE